MKLNRIFFGVTLLCSITFLSSCSDDKASSPKQQLKINGNTVSLKDANIYLTYSSSCCDGIEYRNYELLMGSLQTKVEETVGTLVITQMQHIS